MNRSLLDYLRDFNAKERFFLLGHALGNPGFALSSVFRNEIASVLDIRIPEDHFCAMDYHLDWLYASLRLAAGAKMDEIYSNDERIIKGQQEDLDLLIGYQADPTCHIVIVEAKGVTGWTNKQMNSKAARLSKIFGRHGENWRQVVPHFLLMSPKEPQRLAIEDWPEWMAPQKQVPRIALQVPSTLIKVSRCNKNGKADAKGSHWKVKNR